MSCFSSTLNKLTTGFGLQSFWWEFCQCLIKSPLYAMCCFSLPIFKMFCLCLIFKSLFIMCLVVGLLEFIFLGVCCVIVTVLYFIKFGDLILWFVQIFTLSFFSSSFWVSHNMWVFGHLGFSWLFSLCSLFLTKSLSVWCFHFVYTSCS